MKKRAKQNAHTLAATLIRGVIVTKIMNYEALSHMFLSFYFAIL